MRDIIDLRRLDIRGTEEKLLNELSENDLYYLALLGVVSRFLRGFTTIGIKIPKIDIAVKIVDTLNIRLIAILDIDRIDRREISDQIIRARKWHNYREGLLKISIYTGDIDTLRDIAHLIPSETPMFIKGDLCREIEEIKNLIVLVDPPREKKCLENTSGNMVLYTERVTEEPEDLSKTLYSSGYRDPSDFLRDLFKSKIDPKISLSKLTRESAALYNISAGLIEKGFLGDIAIYDVSEAPILIPFDKEDLISRYILRGSLRLETLIIDGELIIDNSETLYIGKALYKKARSRLEEILSKIV